MASRALSPVRADPVVEHYMRDVDRSLLRRNLRLSHEERLNQLQELARFADELRRAGKHSVMRAAAGPERKRRYGK